MHNKWIISNSKCWVLSMSFMLLIYYIYIYISGEYFNSRGGMIILWFLIFFVIINRKKESIIVCVLYTVLWVGAIPYYIYYRINLVTIVNHLKKIELSSIYGEIFPNSFAGNLPLLTYYHLIFLMLNFAFTISFIFYIYTLIRKQND